MLLFILLVQTPAWQVAPNVPEANRSGMKVELRSVAGSSFEEIRVSTSSSETLQALCDAVWAKAPAGQKPEGAFKKRVLIRESATERWTYEQIHVPVASDRDYVMVVTQVAPPSSGRCEVRFETRTDPAFPPVGDHVRIPNIRGSWRLVQGAPNRVDISYVVFSDPGGSVPAFLARGPQRDAAVGFLKTILARATAFSRAAAVTDAGSAPAAPGDLKEAGASRHPRNRGQPPRSLESALKRLTHKKPAR